MRYKGLYVAQQPAEFEAWKERVAEVKPEVYLEIGSLDGGTLLMVSEVLPPKSTIIVVDVFESTGLKKTLTELKSQGFDTHLIVGDSTVPEMAGRIGEILDGRWIDAAFIDGDHCFAACVCDYHMLLKMMREGGLMGFHDLVTCADEPGAVVHSVDEAWDYIKAQHPGKTTEYIVELPKIRPAAGSVGNGIGVVEV